DDGRGIHRSDRAGREVLAVLLVVAVAELAAAIAQCVRPLLCELRELVRPRQRRGAVLRTQPVVRIDERLRFARQPRLARRWWWRGLGRRRRRTCLGDGRRIATPWIGLSIRIARRGARVGLVSGCVRWIVGIGTATGRSRRHLLLRRRLLRRLVHRSASGG